MTDCPFWWKHEREAFAWNYIMHIFCEVVQNISVWRINTKYMHFNIVFALFRLAIVWSRLDIAYGGISEFS